MHTVIIFAGVCGMLFFYMEAHYGDGDFIGVPLGGATLGGLVGLLIAVFVGAGFEKPNITIAKDQKVESIHTGVFDLKLQHVIEIRENGIKTRKIIDSNCAIVVGDVDEVKYREYLKEWSVSTKLLISPKPDKTWCKIVVPQEFDFNSIKAL